MNREQRRAHGWLGRRLIAELRATRFLPHAVAHAGEVIAARLIPYPEGALGGAVSIADTIERKWGVRYSERHMRRATGALVALGFLRVSCPMHGAVCRGGRNHAATYAAGARTLGEGAHRRGRFSLRTNRDIRVLPPPPTGGGLQKGGGLRPSDGVDNAAGVTRTPPSPPPEAAAPPAELAEGPPGRYARRLATLPSDLFDR